MQSFLDLNIAVRADVDKDRDSVTYVDGIKSDNCLFCPECGHKITDEFWEYTHSEEICPSCDEEFHVETRHWIAFTTKRLA